MQKFRKMDLTADCGYDRMVGMRVLICGGRNFKNSEIINEWLEDVMPVDLVIHGGAPGADTRAGLVAAEHGIPTMVFLAQWAYYGKKAGPIRNQWMLDFGKPNLVLAFPDENSIGTWDMVRRSQAAGIETRIYE